MCWLRAVSLISVIFFTFSSVAAVGGNNYWYTEEQPVATTKPSIPGNGYYNYGSQPANGGHITYTRDTKLGDQSANGGLPVIGGSTYRSETNFGGLPANGGLLANGGLPANRGQLPYGTPTHIGQTIYRGQPNYGGQQRYNVRPRQLEYKCNEGNLQYDCVFYDVHIDMQTQGVYFGFEDITLNNQKNVTFKNSTVRKLPASLLASYRQVELLNLNDLQIEEIDTNAFAYAHTIQELYMGFNAIRYLPPYVFQNVPSLTVLVLERNDLTSLPRGIFHNTPKLSVLSMSNNNLERIEDDTFQATTALQYLQLSSNRLTHVDLSLIPSLFHGNVSYNLLSTLAIPIAVKELDASHNSINVIRGPVNVELAILKLQHNNLTDTAWLLNYPGLVDVDLSYNQLEKITYQQFVKMQRLERLYVSNNHLVALNLYGQPIPTLKVLDLSHNHLLHVERNQPQFDRLEYLYLDHNSIVTLKLSSHHTLNTLTLSHNDWDCNSLRALFRTVARPAVDDADQNCKIDYQLEHGLCCKESDKPYLDRLLQYIALTSVVEKAQRAQGRCSATDAINSVQSLSHYITQQGVVPLQGNEQLEAEVNELSAEVQQLTNEQIQQEQLLQGLHAEIDTNLRRFRLPKDGLARSSDNLNKVFTHLKERHAFKLRETQARRTEADAKQKETEDLEQENIALEKQLDNKRTKQAELRQETLLKRQKVKQLEAKKNRNPDTRRVTK
uniref:APL1C n=1 Tax=Anopheles merus TaxID=30066 RepID=F2YBQ2_ANOME|nr:APL1C [Anopheles merus]